jgi:hypothetical protein
MYIAYASGVLGLGLCIPWHGQLSAGQYASSTGQAVAMMMSFICSCRNKKLGAKLHIYLLRRYVP